MYGRSTPPAFPFLSLLPIKFSPPTGSIPSDSRVSISISMGMKKAETSFLVSHRRPVPFPTRLPRQRQVSASAPGSPLVTKGSPTASVFGRPQRCLKAEYRVDAGRAGEIRRCQQRGADHDLACRTILKSRLTTDADVEEARLAVEAHMCVSGHENIAAIVDVLEDDEAVHIITESCEGGLLSERIRRHGRYTERNGAVLCAALLRATAHCHSCGVTHRGLRPESIMLTSANCDTSVKLADFGHATFFRPSVRMTRVVGTSHYHAPEVLKRSYGPEADIWSIGVILSVVISGAPPFWSGHTDREADMWHSVSRPARDLIRRMLCKEPSERITAEEALAHPWIRMHCEVDAAHTHRARPAENEEACTKSAAACAARHADPLSRACPSPSSTMSSLDDYDSECSSKSSSSAASFGDARSSFHFSPVDRLQAGRSFSEIYSKPSVLPPINTSKRAEGFSAAYSQKAHCAASHSPASSAGSTPVSSAGHPFESHTPPAPCFGPLSLGDVVAALAERIELLDGSNAPSQEASERSTYVIDFQHFCAVVDYNRREQKFGISLS